MLQYVFATTSAPSGTSVNTPNLMHIYRFWQRNVIYQWYSSQVDPKLHVPIALLQIHAVHIAMLRNISICYSMSLQQQVSFWYLSRYTKSDAYFSVLTMKWHIPMVFFPSGLQTAYTYSTFSDIWILVLICYFQASALLGLSFIEFLIFLSQKKIQDTWDLYLKPQHKIVNSMQVPPILWPQNGASHRLFFLMLPLFPLFLCFAFALLLFCDFRSSRPT